MAHRQYFVVSGLLFALVATAHLLRIVYGATILVDSYTVPMVASWIGFIVPGSLTVWAFRLGRSRDAT